MVAELERSTSDVPKQLARKASKLARHGHLVDHEKSQ